MDIDSRCLTCARKQCIDVYELHKKYEEYQHKVISVKYCPLYCFVDENAQQDDGKKEWA